LTKTNPKNFLGRANLALAMYLSLPEPDRYRALQYADDALAAWPKEWDAVGPDERNLLENQMNWTKEKVKHYRQCETAFRDLLRLRLGEYQRKVVEKNQAVDALFGPSKAPVRLVADSGKFEPGELAKAEREKLPPDALKIVQQLVLWMPDDPRLQWLLA